MKKMKITAAVLAAAAALQCFAGCGKKDEIKVPDTTNSTADGENVNNFDAEGYYNKVLEKVQSAEVGTDAPQLGSLGDVVTPEADSAESNLGTYRVSSNGVKLYFNEEEYASNLLLTLEQYFLSYQNADYTKYTSCVFPSFIDEMGTYLQKDYGYDFKTSFAKQCASLANIMHGDYKITRIRVEKPKQHTEGVDNLDSYFKGMDEHFGKAYHEQVKGECNNLIDACFYVMGEDSNGNESVIVNGYEIVFAEKDGRYYTFG
ncbi:hypothetical protein [Ruminococcus flavefaciens]|uniref:Lipoprotein n=1 Tax=Ruminococcus flavefaciens TaxID=1265 RepID=A0A1M7KCU1_RUMFL|nr:hypothetical protein [Ruminococcus flavefaciens]SHM63044.1 hypothetical protein SAMN04487860_10848 [Ruminococcus flavefaciens]